MIRRHRISIKTLLALVMVQGVVFVPGLGAEGPAEKRIDLRVDENLRTRLRGPEALGPGPIPSRPLGDLSATVITKAVSLERAIDHCVEGDMYRIGAPGAAVAVVLDGELLYENGYGVKHQLDRGDVAPDTVFRIGSVTKQMTAAVVMQQVELGRVDLSEPVTTFVPEFWIGGQWPAETITVWNLLTHTSAFPDYVSDISSLGDGALSRWARSQGTVKLQAPPGSFWNYSNPNFMLAGLVAERASGVPYRDLFKQNLWEPAGMHHTTFDPEDVLAGGNWAYGHDTNSSTGRRTYLDPTDNDWWTVGPAGTAYSTVGDLVRWALLLMDGGGPVLAPSSAAEMQKPHVWMHYTPDLFYGYGIMLEQYQGLDVLQHGGNIPGYGAFLLWVPERRFAVALLDNVMSSLNLAAYCIVDAVLDPPPVEPPDLSTDPVTWGRYAGHYSVAENDWRHSHAEVFLDGERLMITVSDPRYPDAARPTGLRQEYLDTFLFDSDGDGILDKDFTFCSQRGKPGFVRWIRNRQSVGEKILETRSPGRHVSP